MASIDALRLGMNLHQGTTTSQLNYLQASRITHVRYTAYMDQIMSAGPYQVQFYVDMQTFRGRGLKVMLVFHEMPPGDPYGDSLNLPQVIVNTIFPDPHYGGPIKPINDIVIAVQLGNENNVDNPSFTPYLHGGTAYARGQSHGNQIVAIRQALDARAGGSAIQVWTTGVAGQDGVPNPAVPVQDFFNGVLSVPGVDTALRGLCVHCYGYPPDHQLRDFGRAANQACLARGVSIPIYSTEVGSEKLASGTADAESDGALQVQNALYWLSEAGPRQIRWG